MTKMFAKKTGISMKLEDYVQELHEEGKSFLEFVNFVLVILVTQLPFNLNLYFSKVKSAKK